MVDKNKAVFCSLLATSAIMLSSEKKKRKRKMCSKKWCLERNISCDVHLLNGLSALRWWCGQVNWGNCGIPWVNCAVLCVEDDWKIQFWGLGYFLSKLRSLLSFPSGMTLHSKIAQFNWEFIWRLTSSENIAVGPSLLERAVMGHAKLDMHRRYLYMHRSLLKEKPSNHRVGI